MYTATVTVVTVGRGLKVAVIWSVMFIFTLVQSRTHVDTVQTVLHFMNNSRYICWSHTMKVFGSHVTFVRRNSPGVVTLRNMYVVMKVWSRMFAVNVQSVSVQQLKWNLISWYISTSNSLAAVCVVKVSNVKFQLNVTLSNVLTSAFSVIFDLCVWVIKCILQCWFIDRKAFQFVK